MTTMMDLAGFSGAGTEQGLERVSAGDESDEVDRGLEAMRSGRYDEAVAAFERRWRARRRASLRWPFTSPRRVYTRGVTTRSSESLAPSSNVNPA